MKMSKQELTLKQAETIVNDMYQKRWQECGIDDGSTIHLGNLDKLKYSELERASILLLRTEMRLTRENKHLKNQLQQEDNAIDECIELVKKIQDEFDEETKTMKAEEFSLYAERLKQSKNK